MVNLYFFLTTVMVVLMTLLMCSVVSLFSFKQKVYTIRKEISQLDQVIAHESKKRMILEVDYTLEHTSTRIQKMADQLLPSRFTNVKQLMVLDEVAAYNNAMK